MSTQYPGGFITKSPVAPTSTAASGIWTVDQALQYVKAGTWPSPPVFIEDLFSTYLYTGNGSTQTITNGIDLSTKGGLVWIKARNSVNPSTLFDTARGATKYLYTVSTAAQGTAANTLTSFNTTGFSLGTDATIGTVNTSGDTYASWTFCKQPKFFDIVTWTGDGVNPRAIPHSLGSVPGFIIIKCTSTTGNWWVAARTSSGTYYRSGTTAGLNSTAALAGPYNLSSDITATSFVTDVVSAGDGALSNANGATYVAYLFAHNAGGFPANGGGSTNGISCGSYTGNGAAGGQLINLGYEAQWVMIKNVSSATDWWMLDTMRGWTVNGDFGSDQALFANLSAVEQGQVAGQPDALGFRPIQDNVNQSGQTYIYIAIRRGPTKTPTVGTSVFTPTSTNAAASTSVSIGFPTDMSWGKSLGFADATWVEDRLRGYSNAYNATAAGTGISPALNTTSSLAETTTQQPIFYKAYNTTALLGQYYAGSPAIYFNFGRAPGFFDVVCYTGTGVAMTVSHNLNVVPEIIIVKNRVRNANWRVYVSALGPTKYLDLNGNGYASINTNAWNDTSPTASVFTVGTGVNGNASGEGIVAYLFATLAGVSKVGSYTGTAALQTVNCGFTSGARFVLIKRTDLDGDWYVYDSARGISSSTDPYYLLNSTASQVTGTDYVDTDTTGFKLNAAGSTTVNINTATYIFLAIA